MGWLLTLLFPLFFLRIEARGQKLSGVPHVLLELSAAVGIRCAVLDKPFNRGVLLEITLFLGGASVADQVVTLPSS